MRVFFAAILVVLIAGGGIWAYKTYFDKEAGLTAPDFAEAAHITSLEALGQSAPSAPPADEAFYKALAENLGAYLTVSYGAIEDDVARDVTITPADNESLGLRIEELRLWGVDKDRLQQFANNEAADNGVTIAERIDARGLSWFGVDKFTDQLTDAYIDIVTDFAKQAANTPGDQADLFGNLIEQEIVRYDLTAARMVIDGLVLHPLPPALTPPETEDAGAAIMHFLRQSARWSRLVEIRAAAFYDLINEAAYEQAGQYYVIRSEAQFNGVINAKQGDVEFVFAKGMTFSMDSEASSAIDAPDEADAPSNEKTEIEIADSETLPSPALYPAAFSVNLSGGVDRYSIQGVKLAKLFDYLARGETPPMSQTDLMSLGVMRMSDLRYMLNDKPFYSVGQFVFDLSDFHWFAPEKIRFIMDDLTYDIEGMLAMVTAMDPSLDESENTELKKTIEQSRAILAANDVSTITIDINVDSAWAAESGQFQSSYFIDVEKFGRLEVSGAGAWAPFEVLAKLAPPEGAAIDYNELSEISMTHTKLENFSLSISDEGGVDRVFSLAVAFADLAPEGDASVAMIKGADPADLKLSSAAMLRLSAGQAAASFPMAKDLIIACADFIQKGGRVKINLQPEKPLSMNEVMTVMEENDAVATADLFGLGVEYEPPGH